MTKCVYCGEEEATEVIINPNFDDLKNPTWDVCKDCKDVIKEQQKHSFGMIIMGIENVTKEAKGFNQEFGKKLVNEANEKLKEIADRTKKPILNACIYKKKNGKYDTSSIEVTGEK